MLQLADDERLTLFLLVEHRAFGSQVQSGMESNDRLREQIGQSAIPATLAARLGQRW